MSGAGAPRKTVLITGIAGFIGSNLADRLIKAGHQVRGVDNLSYGPREQVPQGAEFHKADLRDKDLADLFKDVDTVFHLAAKNCISDCQANPVETSDINVTGTVNVFESARKTGVRKVVYAESSALYEGSHTFPTPEHETRPQSFYAESKLAARAFAEAYHRHHRMNFTALRYFNVYGPRQDYRRSIPPVMSAFILKLLKGEKPAIYGNGKKRRDFVHVDDVNDFHLLCLSDPRTDRQTFNLGSGANHSILDIYKIVEDLLKAGIKPEFKSDLPGEAETTLADIRKAQALGWKPRTTMREGLRGMVDYLKEAVEAGRA